MPSAILSVGIDIGTSTTQVIFSKLTMDKACHNVMTHTGIGIREAFLLAARNPGRVIGMDHEIGTIAPGKKANLVFTDEHITVKNVMLEGIFI